MITEKELIKKLKLVNTNQKSLVSDIYSSVKLIKSNDIHIIQNIKSLCNSYIENEQMKELYIKLLTINSSI
jgi:hypothetical protein